MHRYLKYIYSHTSVILAITGMLVALVALSQFFLKDGDHSHLVEFVTGVAASLIGAAAAYFLSRATKFASGEKPVVFISYAHQDHDFAKSIVKALQTIGAHPLIDRHELKVGDNIRAVLNDMLDKSDFILFVVSPNSAKSDWGKNEIEQAMKKGKRILPVVLDRSSIPSQLSDLYYADFTKGFDEGFRQLLRTLRPKTSWKKHFTMSR
jgi:hypothetical protein